MPTEPCLEPPVGCSLTGGGALLLVAGCDEMLVDGCHGDEEVKGVVSPFCCCFSGFLSAPRFFLGSDAPAEAPAAVAAIVVGTPPACTCSCCPFHSSTNLLSNSECLPLSISSFVKLASSSPTECKYMHSCLGQACDFKKWEQYFVVPRLTLIVRPSNRVLLTVVTARRASEGDE